MLGEHAEDVLMDILNTILLYIAPDDVRGPQQLESEGVGGPHVTPPLQN